MNDTIVNSNLHGVIAIINERNDQIHKHGRTIESDILHNPSGQLIDAARALLKPTPVLHDFPDTWGIAACRKLINKSYQERKVIAAALIAADYDRVEVVEKRKKESYPLTPKEAHKLAK